MQITKSRLSGSLELPPSKSQTLRAILFASLANGESTIRHYLRSPDTDRMIQACQSFGASITISDNELAIRGTAGKVEPNGAEIHCGNSGIIARFLTGVLSASSKPIIITGDASIQNQRPLTPLVDALRQLGASITYLKKEGFAPISISGLLKPGPVTISGEDSQHVSALLIATSLTLGNFDIRVENPGEQPWVDLTKSWLNKREAFDYTVPTDMSTLAFPLIASLLTDSSLQVENLRYDPLQGDAKIIETLISMGANITLTSQGLDCSASSLHGREIDVNSMIDAIVPLAIIATAAKGKTHLTNAAVARTKECDRLACLTRELRKMGADITEQADGLVINGSPLAAASLDSHNDHRMAMALAIAAMSASGESTLTGVECIDKTFPGFVETFHRLGAQIYNRPLGVSQ